MRLKIFESSGRLWYHGDTGAAEDHSVVGSCSCAQFLKSIIKYSFHYGLIRVQLWASFIMLNGKPRTILVSRFSD